MQVHKRMVHAAQHEHVLLMTAPLLRAQRIMP
jgi:hypothetical protein